MAKGSKAPDVLVVGHLCVDFHPRLTAVPSVRPGSLSDTGPLGIAPGGSVANTGGDLAALGFRVSLAADVGDDPLARLLEELVVARGLDASGLHRGDGSTSYSIVIETPGVDRLFWHHVGANAGFDGSRVRFSGERVLHVGYPPLLPALSAHRGAALQRLLGRAHASGLTTSLDLAVVDSPDASTRAEWAEFLAAVLPDVDVITPSHDDLRSMLGSSRGSPTSEPLSAARYLVSQGAAIALVSAGKQGFALVTADHGRFEGSAGPVRELSPDWYGRELVVPAVAVTVPTTTTGAGDAATAGFLAAILEGTEPRDAIERAATVAAAKVSGEDLHRYAVGQSPNVMNSN